MGHLFPARSRADGVARALSGSSSRVPRDSLRACLWLTAQPLLALCLSQMADLFAEVDALNDANKERMKTVAKLMGHDLQELLQELEQAPPNCPGFRFRLNEEGLETARSTWHLSDAVMRDSKPLALGRVYPLELEGAGPNTRSANVEFFEMYEDRYGPYHGKWADEFVKAVRIAVRSIAHKLNYVGHNKFIPVIGTFVDEAAFPRHHAPLHIIPPAGPVLYTAEEDDLVWGDLSLHYNADCAQLVEDEKQKSLSARKLWAKARGFAFLKSSAATQMRVDLWLNKNGLLWMLDAKKEKAAADRRAALEVPPKRQRFA